jgi:uncharacterized protein (DUF433 family)
MPEAEVLAFSAEQVRRLTGLSSRQLRYWERTEFFLPDYPPGARPSRVYSFRDVVGLYTIARLRKDYDVSLQELRRIGEYLREHHETPWASLGFYLQRGTRRFYFRTPDAPDRFLDVRPEGQEVISFEMQRIANDVRERVREFRRRRPDQVGTVEQSRRVVGNAPVLAGTRVPTSAVWSFHAAGRTTEEILREYPTLTAQDVEAAIEYESAQRRKKKAAG